MCVCVCVCACVCVCVCMCVCVRACRHNTTVFHLQCSLYELMLNVLVHSYGHVRTLSPFYGTCAQSSHRCVWCGFEPRSGHVRQTKFCLRVCQVVLSCMNRNLFIGCYWMLSINSTNKGEPVCPSNRTDIPTP